MYLVSVHLLIDHHTKTPYELLQFEYSVNIGTRLQITHQQTSTLN